MKSQNNQIKGEVIMDRKTQYCQAMSSKLIYKFNTIPVKNTGSYFLDINKLILKFIWEGKRLRIANMILKKEEQSWRTDTN